MPNRKEDYVDMEKYRKTRYAQRKRYYSKTANKYEQRKWTENEDKKVLAREKTDSELSREIKRSVAAIQNRRYVLKKRQ